MAVRHSFPSDGEYKFSVQNFGLGKFIPGEKLEFLIDNEAVEIRDYVGVGLEAAQLSDNDGSIDVTIPVKAGSHMVGVTFLATNYRPSLDLIRQYERKSLEDNPHPAVAILPGDRHAADSRTVHPNASGRLAQHSQSLHRAEPSSAQARKNPAPRIS